MGAGHQLHLVENHQRQQKVVIEGAKDSHHHRSADSQTFLGTAKDDGDTVLPVKAKPLTAEISAGVDAAEQDEAHEDKAAQVPDVQLPPVTVARGVGKGGVHNEPDSRLVVPPDKFLVAKDPWPQPPLAELPEKERQQDLVADFQYCIQTDVYAAGIVLGKEDADEQGRQENA